MSPRHKEADTPKARLAEAQIPENKTPRSAQPAPLFFEMSITIARLLVLGVGVAVTLLSFLAGANLWAAALRGGSAILSLGLLTWLTNWFLVQDALKIATSELAKKSEREPVESTVELQA